MSCSLKQNLALLLLIKMLFLMENHIFTRKMKVKNKDGSTIKTLCLEIINFSFTFITFQNILTYLAILFLIASTFVCVRVCDPTSYRYLHLKKGLIAFSFTSVFISYWIILKSRIRLIRGYLIMLQEDNFNVRLIFCFLISYNSSINDIFISGT